MKKLLLGLFLLPLMACTPDQVTAFIDITRPTQKAAEDRGLTHNVAVKLRKCESGGRYEITNRTGKYRGAYQFDQRTWDGVARRHFPWLEGRDPAATEPWWQDAMAQALWSERGPQPWPHCGPKALR